MLGNPTVTKPQIEERRHREMMTCLNRISAQLEALGADPQRTQFASASRRPDGTVEVYAIGSAEPFIVRSAPARSGLKPGQSIEYDYEVGSDGPHRKVGERIIDGP